MSTATSEAPEHLDELPRWSVTALYESLDSRQFRAAVRHCGRRMLDLVLRDLVHDRPRLQVLGWKATEMILQMMLDLALGLREKTEVPAVAEHSSRGTEQKRTAIP